MLQHYSDYRRSLFFYLYLKSFPKSAIYHLLDMVIANHIIADRDFFCLITRFYRSNLNSHVSLMVATTHISLAPTTL